MIHIGIDPGLGGAVAVVRSIPGERCAEVELVSVNGMPVETSPGARKVANRVSAPALAHMLSLIAADGQRACVWIEHVGARPKQGVSSMFSLGDSFGVVRGVCGALGLPVSFVQPLVWKRVFGLIRSDKDASRTRAIELFPQQCDLFARKKDHGRAEAVLIACYGAIVSKG